MITQTNISFGNKLGAQMSDFAGLINVAKKNKQDIVIFSELKNFKRRFLIEKAFDLGDSVTYIRRIHNPIPELWNLQFVLLPEMFSNFRIYKAKKLLKLDSYFYRYILHSYKDFLSENYEDSVYMDKKLLNLSECKNYDIRNGFGTYQSWKNSQEYIKNTYTFKKSVQKKAKQIFNNCNFLSGRRIVSVHFRRGDYLTMSSLNLENSYYEKALTFFNKEKYQLLIFSDDISYCKKLPLFKDYNTYFMKPHSAAVDMAVMTLCNDNIIANSSFSFWGAFLNKHDDKKVVCPHDYIGISSPEYCYINGNYYPEDWTAL